MELPRRAPVECALVLNADLNEKTEQDFLELYRMLHYKQGIWNGVKL